MCEKVTWSRRNSIVFTGRALKTTNLEVSKSFLGFKNEGFKMRQADCKEIFNFISDLTKLAEKKTKIKSKNFYWKSSLVLTALYYGRDSRIHP